MRAVNLLPPEEAERSAARRRRVGYLFLMMLYVGALALGYLFFAGRADQAEEDLATQQATNQEIREDIGRLASADSMRSDYRARANDVSQILASDISWGRLLNDLARLIPDRVWLTSLTASASVSEANPGSFGQVTMAGTAFDYPDAASWLRTLDSDRWPAIGAAWVNSTAVEAVAGGIEAVNFSSIGNLTDAAISRRIDERIPEVPQ